MSKKAVSKRMLTEFLEKLGQEAITVNDEGTIITRAVRLAEIVWEHALGFETENMKTNTITAVKPQVWAINLLYDRLEGKTASASEPGKSKITAANKMSALTRAKLNRLAEEKKSK